MYVPAIYMYTLYCVYSTKHNFIDSLTLVSNYMYLILAILEVLCVHIHVHVHADIPQTTCIYVVSLSTISYKFSHISTVLI